MTTGTMTAKRGDLSMRIEVLYYDGKDCVGQALNTSLIGKRVSFDPEVWDFVPDTPVKEPDTPTNAQLYAAMAPGTIFKVALAATGDVLGYRMKVNDRWYVDVIGSLEPKGMEIVHLIDSKYTITLT